MSTPCSRCLKREKYLKYAKYEAEKMAKQRAEMEKKNANAVNPTTKEEQPIDSVKKTTKKKNTSKKVEEEVLS